MPPTPSASAAARWLTWGRHALIGALLALMILDGIPLIPPRFRASIQPVVRALGLYQTHWELFAPNPDSQNHQLTARVEYANGVVVDWQAPDWRQESSTQRFLSNRYSKYFDNIRNPGFAEFWPALANHIAVEARGENIPADVPPRKVTITLREGTIPDPRFFPWPPVSERAPLDDAWVLHVQEYP